MSKFDIKSIASHIADNPLFEPNRYEVIITAPVVDIKPNVLFNCHRCDIPSHSIGTFEHSLIGPKRNIPNEEMYDNISMSFYNSHHLDELVVLDKWMKKIGGDESYRFAYYNDIVGDMMINIYDLQENLTSEVHVFQVYPTGISELELSYTGEAPSDITVTFAFHSFEITQIKKEH